MTIAALFSELAVKLDEFRDELLQKRETLVDFVKRELGEDVRFCALPWCRRPFIAKRPTHLYCSKAHKDEARNKSR